MKRLIAGAIGLVVAWFFVLLAIAVLGIIAAIATNVQQGRHIAAVHTPMTADVISHEMVGFTQTHDPVATEPAFAAIINVMGVPPAILSLFTGTMLLALFIGAFVIAWRFTRRTAPRDDTDSGTVQELYHLGKNLDKRMEALETILLERGRPAP